MSGERARELIARGIESAEAGRRDEAQRLLARALAVGPDVRDMIRAWRRLAQLADHPDERRVFLERMLAADPFDGYARRELGVLNGDLRRENVSDPELTQSPAAASPDDHVSPVSVLCARCGGRTVADAQSRQVRCQHCGHAAPVEPDPEDRAQDVTAALWSGRGHGVPRTATVVACGGCGASFFEGAETLSAACPYCATAYVAAARDTRSVIAPDGIVPFVITASQAEQALEGAGVEGARSSLRGLYAPVWIVTFSGEVDWNGRQRDRSGFGSDRSEEVSGTYTVVEVRTCVPAGRHGPAAWSSSMIEAFEWRSQVPYQPSLLASWPAETYQVSLDAATVTARKAAIALIRSEVREGVDGDVEHLEMHCARVVADAFQLVLVPLWIADIADDGERTTAFVNGQSGALFLPERPGWWHRMSRLFGPSDS
jgi:DNA-directed RNA polymerase subunit RPC12/RpoP